MVNFIKVNNNIFLFGNNKDLIKNSKLIVKLSEHNSVKLKKNHNYFCVKINSMDDTK